MILDKKENIYIVVYALRHLLFKDFFLKALMFKLVSEKDEKGSKLVLGMVELQKLIFIIVL